MRAEYTLKQATRMIRVIMANHEEHRETCDTCADILDKEYDLDRCQEGRQILKNFLKWNRRFAIAGKREGKAATPFRVR